MKHYVKVRGYNKPAILVRKWRKKRVRYVTVQWSLPNEQIYTASFLRKDCKIRSERRIVFNLLIKKIIKKIIKSKKTEDKK